MAEKTNMESVPILPLGQRSRIRLPEVASGIRRKPTLQQLVSPLVTSAMFHGETVQRGP